MLFLPCGSGDSRREGRAGGAVGRGAEECAPGEGEGEGGVEDRPQQLEQMQRPSKRLLRYQERVEQVYTRPTNLPEGAKDTGPFKKSNKVEGIVKELRLRELANYTNLRA